MEENLMSLKLKVEIETTDTAERKSISALVDCGATGEFINRHYAKAPALILSSLLSQSWCTTLMACSMKLVL
jgi:hypothetical protein